MSWNKPLPQATTISQPFWDSLKAQKVSIQQCDDCQHWIFFPRAHCSKCASPSLSWRTISGEGSLYTYTVARIPTLPEFSDEMPQLLAVIELDEGPHLNTTLVGIDPSQLSVGMRMRPVFDMRPGDTALLRYTPEGSAHASVMAADADKPQAATPQPDNSNPPRRQIQLDDLDALQALVSIDFTDWSNEFRVTQELIDQFAALSGDDYWIHTDPGKAKERSPFGTTIAQGALVQVLISRLNIPLDYEVVGFNNMVNYGSDRLRFATPVPSECKIHARSRVKSVEKVKSGVQLTMEINIHVVGQDRPSVINDLIILYM